jgi:hypothetical protein
MALQAAFVTICLRRYARFRASRSALPTQFSLFLLLSMVMLIMLCANFLQIALWAGVFVAIGEFSHFPTALYHSAVSFVTLGYGDIVMEDSWRLLGPMEGANGVLMFGVSTAVITGAVIEVIKENRPDRDSS